MPQIFLKSMHENKTATYLLFLGLVCMLAIMQAKIFQEGTFQSRSSPVAITTKTVSLESYIDALNISIASFGFVLTLFPVYNSMKRAKRREFKVSLLVALALVFSLYLALSVSSILYFGQENVMPSIFDNFSDKTDW